MLQKIKFFIFVNNFFGKSKTVQRFSAQAEYSLGHTTEAERDLKEAIDIRENILNSKDKQLKEMLETMGRLLYKQSRSQEADQYYSRAKAIIIN